MNAFKRFTASVLIASTTMMGMPLTAQASMVGTEEVITVASAADREKVTSFLEREDVRTALEAQGLNGSLASERVKAMSDAEVSQLASRVDQAPAGGILGVLFTVFIVLLVTDILGLTSVFPFTRSVR